MKRRKANKLGRKERAMMLPVASQPEKKKSKEKKIKLLTQVAQQGTQEKAKSFWKPIISDSDSFGSDFLDSDSDEQQNQETNKDIVIPRPPSPELKIPEVIQELPDKNELSKVIQELPDKNELSDKDELPKVIHELPDKNELPEVIQELPDKKQDIYQFKFQPENIEITEFPLKQTNYTDLYGIDECSELPEIFDGKVIIEFTNLQFAGNKATVDAYLDDGSVIKIDINLARKIYPQGLLTYLLDEYSHLDDT